LSERWYMNTEMLYAFEGEERRTEGIRRSCPLALMILRNSAKRIFYYVDKNGLIIELMQNWGEVNLLTRPRRFGVMLNMSMLKYFFEVGGDKSIFDELKVAQEKALCEAQIRRYRVKEIWTYGIAFWDQECRVVDVLIVA